MDYKNPRFDIIKQRIEDRIAIGSNYRAIGKKDFPELSPIEVMSLVWFYINLLKACSFEDLVFVFNSAFKGHANEKRIREVLSVLVGAGIVERDGPLGLARIADKTIILTKPSKSYNNKLIELSLEITNMIEDCCNANYVEAAAHAD